MKRNLNSAIGADDAAAVFSPASLAGERVQPGEKLDCSSSAGWTALLVQTSKTSTAIEAFETLLTPDQTIVLVTRGGCEIESFSGGSWKKAVYRPGCGGMTVGGNTSRLRWQSKVCSFYETLHIYLPQYFLAAAEDEYRRAGTAFRSNQPDALSFCDPVIFQTGLALKEALCAGAPNLYAESAAQLLATHLLSSHSKWSNPVSAVRNPGSISDRRLARVLEFMQHRYAENLSLNQLSREAGISLFHFIGLFKKSCGITPYQHLIQLRMNVARTLLENNDLSIKVIAAKCGYAKVAHFTAAYRKHFAQTPAEHRKRFAPFGTNS